MLICKCDRCGAYVDKDNIPKIHIIYDSNEFNIISDINKRIDLCYECYAELEKFLRVDKEEQYVD